MREARVKASKYARRTPRTPGASIWRRPVRPPHLTWQRLALVELLRGLQKQNGPGTLRFQGQIMGVGVRHALFPGGTRLDALAFAGDVLPDATLRGMRMFRSHGGTVLAVAGRDLLSEASSPSSVAPCRERRAGRGADTSAILLRVG